MSESYDRAEAVLDELLPTIDASKDHVGLLSTTVLPRENDIGDYCKGNAEFQELRWLRLAVLKRRKTGEAALLNGKLGLDLDLLMTRFLRSVFVHH